MEQQALSLFAERYVKGKLLSEIFHNEENLYSVMRFSVEETTEAIAEKEIVVVGHYPRPYPDEVYVFYGEWVHHPKYGLQYRADRYEKELPKTKAGIVKYLSSGLFYGIGKKTAQKIVDHLGENALQIILEEPEKLAEIPGISPARARTIHQGVAEHRALEQAMVFLYEFGIGPSLAIRIYQHYLQDTLHVIQNDPYRLIEDIQGIGFKRADQIGQAVGIAKNSPERVRAAVFHLLYEAAQSEGHVFLPLEKLVSGALALLNEGEPVFAEADVERLVWEMGEEGKIMIEGRHCYLPSLFFAERGFAAKVKRMARRKTEVAFSAADFYKALGEVEEKLSLQYADSQREAIETALRSPLMILTGGPGTGKTTVIKGICEVMARLEEFSLDPSDYRDPEGEPYPVLLVAPTGRAAKRMSEATGLPAMTIHRLLGWKGDGFEHDADHPLQGRLLIVDEMSMVDIWLANQLFRALPEEMKVVLVGDPDQLPSVGPGRVLKDLLDSRIIPSVHLTQIYRQASGSSIIELAHQIREGRVADDIAEAKGDRRFFPCSAEQVVEVVKQVCASALKKGYQKRDIQVLAPMYKGNAGVNKLNEELQRLFNPPSPGKRELRWGDTVYRTGDKVLQLTNNPEEQVFNGDLGEIVAILQPDEAEFGEETLIVQFEQQEVSYRKNQLHQLTLAYCCSIHKAQGSEFPIVVVPVVRGYHRMLRRNLIYTAVTRSKSYLILCGEIEAFRQAVTCSEEGLRYTNLIACLTDCTEMEMI
ncbi:ATP-dependent RecD-like DNA helicase [Bacillaceae bacterium]